MPTRSYNTFYQGVQQDDFLSNGANFIEHKNVDGLKDGYGIRLGPKVNKGFTTGSNKIYSIYTLQFSDGRTDYSYAGGDNGVIYRIDGAVDNTPTHTLTNGGIIIQIVELSGFIYFFYKTSLAFTNISVARISISDAFNDNWGSMDENYKVGSFSNAQTPPVIVVGSLMFIGVNGRVATMDSGGTIVEYNFPDSTVVGITLQGSTIVVYCNSGNVYYWDGGSTNENSRTYVGTRLLAVGQKGQVDYITSEDGQLIIGSGQQFIRATKPKISNRMNDNSINATRLRFGDITNNERNHLIVPALDDIYMYASDTEKGIYKYGKIIPGLNDGLHKIITSNNALDSYDQIYDMVFYERSIRRLYIAYTANGVNGVDYIDLDSLETVGTGYAITDVFTGFSSIEKRIELLRSATQNTAGDNSINLYYRVNNGSWIQFRSINDIDNSINARNIHTSNGDQFRQFTDIQFKIELNNGPTDESISPILTELSLDYTFIKT